MRQPYYSDDLVTLYLGDCRKVAEWLSADVLVTDPPYGISWTRSANMKHGIRSKGHDGIAGDADTSVRDAALALWGVRPGVLFGSFYAPQPPGLRQVLVYHKPPDAGLVGSTTGYRRDVEPVYLTGRWPRRTVQRSGLLASNARLQGGPGGTSGRYGHPHAKPVDVMETLIAAGPNGTIADPFAGAGSTLVAARNLGRRCIGVELEERYCERAARRLSQMTFAALHA